MTFAAPSMTCDSFSFRLHGPAELSCGRRIWSCTTAGLPLAWRPLRSAASRRVIKSMATPSRVTVAGLVAVKMSLGL